MEQNNKGRVVGVIHADRMQPGGNPVRLMFYPQPLRLAVRPDKQTARIVENGLAVYALRGHLAAIDYFSAAGISLRVISRVLWQPERRRSIPF